VLEVRDLRVSYGAAVVLHGLSFDVAHGEVVALIGANGAGKTTTLSALSGLVPATGTIRFEGNELRGRPPHEIVRAGIVQVPEGRLVLAGMSVEENLRLASRDGVDEAYARFPILRERRTLPAGNLSGGEQQMLAIARALLARPRLLLLDEPSLGLAPKVVSEVFGVLADLKRRGTTMLLVEQNAAKALRLADRGYVLELGRIALAGRAPDLLRDERVAQAYLGG
jgi:branched-chain amino acid transport system ATP-binding protein